MITEESLRSPPPTVVALLAVMINELPKNIRSLRDGERTAPEMIDDYWQQIVTELVKR